MTSPVIKNIDQSQWDQDMPPQVHELVIPEPWYGPSNPHEKKNKNTILINNASTPRMVMALSLSPRLCINGKLKPPKYRVDIAADEINILMYSSKEVEA